MCSVVDPFFFFFFFVKCFNLERKFVLFCFKTTHCYHHLLNGCLVLFFKTKFDSFKKLYRLFSLSNCNVALKWVWIWSYSSFCNWKTSKSLISRKRHFQFFEKNMILEFVQYVRLKYSHMMCSCCHMKAQHSLSVRWNIC